MAERDDQLREAIEAGAEALRVQDEQYRSARDGGYDHPPGFRGMARAVLEASGLPARLAAVEAERDALLTNAERDAVDVLRDHLHRELEGADARTESAERQLADCQKALRELSGEPYDTGRYPDFFYYERSTDREQAMFEHARTVLARLRGRAQ